MLPVAPNSAVLQLLPPQKHDQRIEDATKSTWQQIKETASLTWHTTVVTIQTVGSHITFIFFRALEWMYPSLGVRVENLFLRFGNIFQAARDAWRDEDVRRNMQTLTDQNDQLHAQNRQLSQQNERLTQVATEFTQRLNAATALQLAQQQREQAVVTQCELLLQRISQLARQNQELTSQLETSNLRLQPALQKALSLQQTINQLQGELEGLRSNQEYNASVNQVLTDLAAIGRASGPKTHVDKQLERLLPLLFLQMEQAKLQLDLAKESLPADSSAEIPLEAFARILSALKTQLQLIPDALRLHTSYQDPLEILSQPIGV